MKGRKLKNYRLRIGEKEVVHACIDYLSLSSSEQAQWDGNAASVYDEGDGSNVAPFLIRTASQLAKLANDSKEELVLVKINFK